MLKRLVNGASWCTCTMRIYSTIWIQITMTCYYFYAIECFTVILHSSFFIPNSIFLFKLFTLIRHFDIRRGVSEISTQKLRRTRWTTIDGNNEYYVKLGYENNIISYRRIAIQSNSNELVTCWGDTDYELRSEMARRIETDVAVD